MMDLNLAQALILTLVVPSMIFALVFLAGKDVCFYKSKSNFHQINLFNWSAPSWGKDFKEYYFHFGPYLKVSRKLVTVSCRTRCCHWVELRKDA